MTYEEMKKNFNQLDTDKGNSVDAKEFAKYFMDEFKGDSDAKFHSRIHETVKYVVRKPALKVVFQHFDTDMSGFLDTEEFERMIKISKPRFAKSELDTLIARIDTDHNQKIDENEFVQYYFQLFSHDNDEEFAERLESTFMGRRRHLLQTVFNAYDRDGNGVLDVNEFAACLRLNGRKFVSADTILDTLQKFDVNRDRTISFAEWMCSMEHMVAHMDDRHFNKAINNMLKGTGVTTEHKHHK
jgi:Ca2+-binding EF-hand superfamily protein